jgi:hypothetical protein
MISYVSVLADGMAVGLEVGLNVLLHGEATRSIRTVPSTWRPIRRLRTVIQANMLPNSP